MLFSVNGDRRWMSMKNFSEEEVRKWLNLITKQAGDTEPIRYRKNWHTDMPSIQGAWTPWTHKAPEELFSQYPNKDQGEKLDLPETATEKLLRLYGKPNENAKQK